MIKFIIGMIQLLTGDHALNSNKPNIHNLIYN